MAAATSRHLTRTRVLRSRMLLTSKPQIVERETGFQFTFAIGLWHGKNLFLLGKSELVFSNRCPVTFAEKV